MEFNFMGVEVCGSVRVYGKAAQGQGRWAWDPRALAAAAAWQPVWWPLEHQLGFVVCPCRHFAFSVGDLAEGSPGRVLGLTEVTLPFLSRWSLRVMANGGKVVPKENEGAVSQKG